MFSVMVILGFTVAAVETLKRSLERLQASGANNIAAQFHRLDMEALDEPVECSEELPSAEPSPLPQRTRVRVRMLIPRLAPFAAAVVLLVLAGHTSVFAADCTTTTAGTEKLADYPAVRAFYDELTTGEAALVDCAVSASWTNTPAAPGTPAGPDGFKPSVQGLHMLFSEYSFTTEDVVADGEKVVVRSTVTAKQVGEFLGVPGGGEPVAFQTIDIHQLGTDGKIAQSWHVEDWLTFLLMRGALPIGR